MRESTQFMLPPKLPVIDAYSDQTSNCVIGSNGKFVIGHNLVIKDGWRKALQPVCRSADEWLKEIFYMIGSEVRHKL